MKASVLIRLVTVLVILVLIGVPVAGQVTAQVDQTQATQGVQTTTLNLTPAQTAAALAFWTHDQLAKAPAFPMPMDKGNPAAVAAAADDQALGPAGSSAPGAAAPDANALAQAAFPEDWKAIAQTASLGAPAAVNGSSQVYTSYPLNWFSEEVMVYPHEWVGRLSFAANGGTGYCSATAISGNNIVTAAHCVYDTTNNLWYNNWVFTPAYWGGIAPYGSFAASSCTILTAWVNLKGNYNIAKWTKYDLAVCHVGNNSGGHSLNYMVGYAGRTWNKSYVNNVFNMGYPWQDYNLHNLSYPGAALMGCTAETFAYASSMGEGCNWGPGISGGPWMIGYAWGFVSGYVDSVNSGLFVGKQNLYGIRFSDKNIVPLCTVMGC